MNNEIKPLYYIDYKVYSITKIKNKYGFRVKLILEDGSDKILQHAGYSEKVIAEKERYKIIAKLENRTYIVYSHLTVKEYMEYWYLNVLPTRLTSEASFDSYKNCVFNHIIPRIGNLKLVSLKKGHVRKLYKEVFEYSKSVARLLQTVLNSALKDAVAKGFIDCNVSDGEKIPIEIIKENISSKEDYLEKNKNKYHKQVINEKNIFSIEEIALLIKESRGTALHMHILFAALMGLRKSEINGIKYSDIDYMHRKLKLHVQLGKKLGAKKEDFKPKTFTKQEIKLKSRSSLRILDIPDIVFNAILMERKKYEENRNRRINDKSNPFQDLNYICCSTYGRPRSKSFVFQPFRELKERLNLPDYPFHRLRKTYSTILSKNNISMKAIAVLLGHSSEMITFENYTDKNEIIQDCILEIEPYLENLLPTNDEQATTLEIDFSEIIEECIMKLIKERI